MLRSATGPKIGEPQFILQADGTFKAIDAVLSGHVEAKSGIFHGRVEAEEGYFKGRIEAGEGFFKGTISGTLDGRNLVTSGNVTAGTAYVLRSNNNALILQGNSVSGELSETIPLKTIRTFATGTCRLRILFPSDSKANNRGYFKVVVNGNVAHDWEQVNGSNNYYQQDINLRSAGDTSGSTIELYMKKVSQSVNYYDFINTTFELRCAENPGLLAMLG
jgi:hypothetical protein